MPRVRPGRRRNRPVRPNLDPSRPDASGWPAGPRRARPGLVGGHHQARPVGAECSILHTAQVRALEPSDRAACLGLDQAKDLVRVLRPERPSGEKPRPSPPIRRASFQVPTAQRRHGDGVVINHFPSGLKATTTIPSTFRSATRAPSGRCQTWAPLMKSGCRSPTIARPG